MTAESALTKSKKVEKITDIPAFVAIIAHKMKLTENEMILETSAEQLVLELEESLERDWEKRWQEIQRKEVEVALKALLARCQARQG